MPVIVDQGRIHRLPTILASQIAAGEVIERPASVIKELLENSLDAGAGRIQIDIEAAGSRLIRVRDDGRGIHPDDLPLAIAPHSTSKIRSAEDLAAIYSLGFRGEALASIAAVARLKIASRHGDLAARELVAEPDGPLPEAAPVAHPAGTTLEVRDLFFNVPARRKFLRSEQTEFLQIIELVKAFALARTGVGFKLTHNGRTAFSISNGSSLPERVSQVFGRGFADQACLVEETDGTMHLHGVAGQAAAARSQADRQYLFLNGRLIRDRRLNHALRSAYAESLPPGRYAPFLLYLEMNAADYDINVHPAKHEVRFRSGRDVHDFIYSTLRRSLAANRPLGEWQPQAGPAAGKMEQHAAVVRETEAASYTVSVAGAGSPAREPAAENQFGRLLGCVLDRYLLTETATTLVVIDGQAALERLTLIELEQAWLEGTLSPRPLLLPQTRVASPAEIGRVEAAQAVLGGLGLRLDVSSPTQIALRAMPVQAPYLDAGDVLEELCSSLPAVGSNVVAANMRGEVFALLARQAGRQFRPPGDTAASGQLLERLAAARAAGRLQAPWPWKEVDADNLAAWLSEHG